MVKDLRGERVCCWGKRRAQATEWGHAEILLRYRRYILASRAWHDVNHAIVEKEKNVGRTWHGKRGLFGIGRSDINVLCLAFPLGSL